MLSAERSPPIAMEPRWVGHPAPVAEAEGFLLGDDARGRPVRAQIMAAIAGQKKGLFAR